MCGLLDDLLPVFGSIAGFMVGGPWGAAIGGALGGFGGSYFQNHDFGQSLFGGAVGGIGGYFGGGNIANGLGLMGDTSTLGDLAGTAAANGAGTLGELEQGAGGAAMFGPAAGTGTAIGSAASSLGGTGLGLAGGDALSGISNAGLGYMGGLGGGYAGTGLGSNSLGGETANLNGVMNGAANPTATAGGGAGTQAGVQAPTSNMGAMTNTPTGNAIPGQGGALGGTTSPSQFTMPGQAPQAAGPSTGGLEGGQAAPMDQNAAAAGAITNPGTPETPTNLSTMYGPTSSSATVAPQGVMGQSIGAAGGNVGQSVQAGALGEAQKTGMDFSDLGSLFGGGGQQGGVSPMALLAKTGLGAYQQYQQQQAQNAYRDQISNIFSPGGAYAQQMAQTLGRQDAAAGRNSQYGTRSVQLAAALAQAQAQALGGSNYYRAATATPGANMLNSLFSNYFANPGAFNQMGSAAFNGLSNLFGG